MAEYYVFKVVLCPETGHRCPADLDARQPVDPAKTAKTGVSTSRAVVVTIRSETAEKVIRCHRRDRRPAVGGHWLATGGCLPATAGYSPSAAPTGTGSYSQTVSRAMLVRAERTSG